MKKLFSQEEIRDGVRRLAEELTDLYGQRSLTIVGILTGSIVLLADLIRQLEMPLRVALIGPRQPTGQPGTRRTLVVSEALLPSVRGRDILVVDDIFGTGHTLAEVIARLKDQGPASIRSAVLMRKVGRSQVACEPDHVVFEIPDEFVVGYGLDYNDKYRNLPYVAALEPGELANE